jgi:outer membrane immunogenic protein
VWLDRPIAIFVHDAFGVRHFRDAVTHSPGSSIPLAAAFVFVVFGLSASTQWLTTLAARFGYAADRWLVYGKAGGGWVSNNVTVTNLTSQVSATTSNTTSGWLLGAGVEFGFTPNWSAKLEYDYLGLSGWTAASPLVADTVNVKRQLNMITTGVNYRFGW